MTFGPRNTRNFYQRIPRTMRKLAFKQVLAEKIRRGNLVIVTDLALPKPKTRLLEAFLQKLPVKEGRILLVSDEGEEGLKRAARNLPYLTLRTASAINVLDLLSADSVVVTKKALAALEQQYAPK